MKTTEWDRIVTSTPLNREAAVVRDGSGDGATRVANIQGVYDAPFLTMPCPSRFDDQTGKRLGRLTVIGFVDNKQTNSGKNCPARWLCKCVCGRYTTRKVASLYNALHAAQSKENYHVFACAECATEQRIRNGKHAKKRPLPKNMIGAP